MMLWFFTCQFLIFTLACEFSGSPLPPQRISEVIQILSHNKFSFVRLGGYHSSSHAVFADSPHPIFQMRLDWKVLILTQLQFTLRSKCRLPGAGWDFATHRLDWDKGENPELLGAKKLQIAEAFTFGCDGKLEHDRTKKFLFEHSLREFA